MVGLLKSNAPTLSLTYPKTLSKTRIPNPETRTSYPATLHHTLIPSNAPTLQPSNPKLTSSPPSPMDYNQDIF